MKNVLAFCCMLSPAFADTPKIVDVSFNGSTVSVTLLHDDTGWDDYADGWEVFDMEGNSLGFRKLHHPHVNEQPFTRSLGNVTPPDGATQVQVRARDTVTGWSDLETFDIKK